MRSTRARWREQYSKRHSYCSETATELLRSSTVVPIGLRHFLQASFWAIESSVVTMDWRSTEAAGVWPTRTAPLPTSCALALFQLSSVMLHYGCGWEIQK